jgi:RNA polymerase sigma-70 factor (ECF subfamily)
LKGSVVHRLRGKPEIFPDGMQTAQAYTEYYYVCMGEITQLLSEVSKGNSEATSRLAELVYDQLHRTAAWFMNGERRDHSLQATILVHEAYLQLVNQEDQNWQNRAHFFAVAAGHMRRILIDHARARNAIKRGGRNIKVDIDEIVVIADDHCEELVIIDEALNRLSEFDERLCRIVELKFFGGLTEEEIAEVLRISPRTVKRDWKVARAWLRGELLAKT